MDSPIRPAATVIVLRRHGLGFQVLMGQRGAAAAFMPSKYVFPGGAVDQADADAPLPAGRLDPACLAALALHPLPDSPPARAILHAALRELAEETGLQARPDASLRFVFRAITPPGRSRRFDARFFLLSADDLLGDPDDFSAAEDELSHLHWIDLAQARTLDLPFITEVVLSEITALCADPQAQSAGVPFFDNSTNTPCFRRLITA